MSVINDPRFSVLEQLQEEPRTKGELFRTLPQSSPKLQRTLGFLREQNLVEIDFLDGHEKYRSNLPLNQNVKTSFVNFLLVLLRMIRTVQNHPELHQEIVHNLQMQLSQSNKTMEALGDLFFKCLVGQVSSPFGILSEHKGLARQSRTSVWVNLINIGNKEANVPDSKAFGEHMMMLNRN